MTNGHVDLGLQKNGSLLNGTFFGILPAYGGTIGYKSVGGVATVALSSGDQIAVVMLNRSGELVSITADNLYAYFSGYQVY